MKAIVTLLWIGGLCMAGAETENFYIINVIGGLLFLAASIFLGNILVGSNE